MTDNKTKHIAELNDRFRRATISGDPAGVPLGTKVLTRGIQAFGLPAVAQIAEQVLTFDAFTPDNDPHGEHDFGAFEFDGQKIFWKIDYYDRASFHSREVGSEDPSDPARTMRVLTIMLASEY
jgi:Protein of unknown function (DUF3768)